MPEVVQRSGPNPDVNPLSNALVVEGISKQFGATKALDNVSFAVRRGEVHGLIGQNGAGKSTLVKIITGVHAPDAGSALTVWGRRVEFPIRDGRRYGLAVVHQDLGLNEEMTVWENLGISSSYGTRQLRPLSIRTEIQRVERMNARYGYHLHPTAVVANISSAERSQLAIMRAIREINSSNDEHLLVLDEPTASLPDSEVRKLLSFVRELADSGSSVIFITHYLNEIMQICDRVTVLRGGKAVGTHDVSSTSAQHLLDEMLGYHVDLATPALRVPKHQNSIPLLKVKNLSGQIIRNIDFEAGKGEILGFTGLVGMGTEELPYLLGGVVQRSGGEVSIGGVDVGAGLAAARSSGIALVPGDRARDGVWLDATVSENLTIQSLGVIAGRYFTSSRAERAYATDAVVRHKVSPADPALKVGTLSGGNQQKVLMAKWLNEKPQILVMHAPTQGVDPGDRRDLHDLIRESSSTGMVYIIVSDDPEELAELCTTVYVLRNGMLVERLDGDRLDDSQIIRALHQT